MKLTLKYSSFLFTNGVSLVKNVPQEINVAKLSNKDKVILNSYIRSGAIESTGGELPVDLEEIVEAVVEAPTAEQPKPIVEESQPEVAVSLESILDAPVEEAKKKAPAKKAPVKK